MTREDATYDARKIANSDRIRMIVTHNPHSEEPDDTKRYGYCPENARRYFPHETVVQTIEPEITL